MFCNRVSIQCLRQAWVIITDAEGHDSGLGKLVGASPRLIPRGFIAWADRQGREGRFSAGVARAAACLWTFAALMCGCGGGFHREPRSWRVL